MTKSENFGDYVREVRARLTCTQKELAQLLDVDPRTIQRWEESGGYPRKRRLLRRLEELMATATAGGKVL